MRKHYRPDELRYKTKVPIKLEYLNLQDPFDWCVSKFGWSYFVDQEHVSNVWSYRFGGNFAFLNEDDYVEFTLRFV